MEKKNNFFLTATYILDLANKTYNLFIDSEIERKRKLIKLILQKLRLDSNKLIYEIRSPFNLVLKFK